MNEQHTGLGFLKGTENFYVQNSEAATKGVQ